MSMDLRYSTKDGHFYTLYFYVNGEILDSISGFIGLAELKRHVNAMERTKTRNYDITLREMK